MFKSLLLVFLFVIFSSYSQEVEIVQDFTTKDSIVENEVSFLEIEEAPSTPECIKLETIKEKNDCFSQYIQKFISKKLNVDLFNSLSLPEGKYTIVSVFSISKEGKIEDINVRAPHPDLETETIRVLQLIPTLIPAKQHGKAVKVKFSLPLTFFVADNKPNKKKKRK